MTQDPFFCLGTTFIGINVTDVFLLANYHKIINYATNACEEKDQKISIQRFSGILVKQLIDLVKKISGPPLRFLPEDCLEVQVNEVTCDISSPTLAAASSSSEKIIRSLHDANGVLHLLSKYEVTKDPSGQQTTKMRACKICIQKGKCCDVGQYCATCGESFSLCNTRKDRDCFHEHVSLIKRITRQTKQNANLP